MSPVFLVERSDGMLLARGKRGGVKWVRNRSSAARFEVGPTSGRTEIREVEDRLVYDGVSFTFKEVRSDNQRIQAGEAEEGRQPGPPVH
jgi:hypothetical protein